jgi:hypothetical protein
MEKEIWKPIVGYSSYEVSNMGNVRSVGRYMRSRWGMSYLKPKYLKGWTDKLGYVRHTFEDRKLQLTHRLVAKAFIPNPDNKPMINHIDNNPSNNRVENLQWCTNAENLQHAAKQGRMANNSSKKVIDVTTGKIYDSIKSAANSIGVIPNTLQYRIMRNSKKNTFRYV